ncbi:endonuclease/exonuclease/phosphatase family protein [Kitasatospora sp. NPDC096147]|uniref:endonuclease/exonuclease/phosphatase family protein n=1 Tax=Kitasatospora sp. NPDC096147 TaxID=3364093 RepID=UPI003820BF3C
MRGGTAGSRLLREEDAVALDPRIPYTVRPYTVGSHGVRPYTVGSHAVSPDTTGSPGVGQDVVGSHADGPEGIGADVSDSDPAGPGAPVAAKTGSPVSRWRRDLLPAALGVLTAASLACHRWLPDPGFGLRSLGESLLPWSGVPALGLLLWAALRRAPAVACAGGAAALVWGAMFGPLLTAAQGPDASGGPGGPQGGAGLTVVTHNVLADNRDPAGTARALLAAHPDLVALQEVTEPAWRPYREVLGAELPHHISTGTVGLWSRYPLTEAGRLIIDPGWNRSLRAEVQAPFGPLAVYVAHLQSVRPHLSGFVTGQRDGNIAELGRAVEAERLPRVLVLGDLNTAPDDHALAPLTDRLTLARDGFGFTWPAAFPVARIDHVLTRELNASTWTLPATGSDHLPLAGRIRP